MTEQEQQQFNDVYYDDLGMCGCGDPDSVVRLIYNALTIHHKYKNDQISIEEKHKAFEELFTSGHEAVFEFMFHVFEKAGLVEHGGSVYSSWFTDKGELFLKQTETVVKEEIQL